MTYRVEFTPQADEALARVRDVRVKRKLVARAEQLSHDPELQGEPLGDELVGYRSVRAIGQRYRIIYRVNQDRVLVSIFWLGFRRAGSKEDVYAEATKQIRNTPRTKKS